MRPPRKLRRTPEDRSLQIGKRMSAGTAQGRVDSASPVRNTIPAKATQRRGGDCVNEEFTWFKTGTLTTGTGKDRWYPPFEVKLFSVHIAADTAPTGASIKVDIHKNGSTIFTNQGNRPQIGAGSNEASAAFINDPLMALGDYLTFDIDQVGSGTAGSDLAVTIGFTVCPSATSTPGAPPLPVGPCGSSSLGYQDGLVLWLSACSLSGTHADGDTIATWPDISGNGNDFTGTGANVKYKTNILNGKPACLFNGDDAASYLDGPDLSAQLPTAVTMFIVWKIPGTSNVYFIFQDSSTFRDGYWRDSASGAGYFTMFRPSRLTGYPATMPNSGSHYMSLISSASTYRAWLDGVDQGAAAASYTCGTSPCFNRVATNSGAHFPGGYLMEFLLFDHALTDDDRTTVESYLTDTYGL